MKTIDYISIEYGREGRSILELQESLNKAIEKLDREHPEWRENENYWKGDTEYLHDYGEVTTLTLYYHREMTDAEVEKHNRTINESIQRDKDTLSRLMEKYPEEVQKILNKH